MWNKVFLSNHITLPDENFWLELSADSISIDYLNSVKSSQNSIPLSLVHTAFKWSNWSQAKLVSYRQNLPLAKLFYSRNLLASWLVASLTCGKCGFWPVWLVASVAFGQFGWSRKNGKAIRYLKSKLWKKIRFLAFFILLFIDREHVVRS